MMAGKTESRLARRLGLGDAIAIGLASMLGAGVFVAPGAAAQQAGSGVLLATAVAGLVAWANATSTARLAALQPDSGGVYAYAGAHIGARTAFIAGWAFTAGKTSSLVAMALAFGAYATPDEPRLGAVAAVISLTAVNLAGVTRTATTARIGALVVVSVLIGFSVLALGSADAAVSNLEPLTGDGGIRGLLGAAGIMFFAFAGYARIATLGEEVRDPERTIPRAIPIALASTLLLYLATAAGALAVLGPEALSASVDPLAAAASEAGHGWGSIVIRAGAAVACAGVLMSLLAGVARTAFAMAADGELPRSLAVVHPTTRVPHVAQLTVGAITLLLVLAVPIVTAIAVSSTCVLTYYAIAHLSALRLEQRERRPSVLAPLGLIGCAVLALSLPVEDVAAGAALIAGGLVVREAAQAGRARH